MPARDQATAEGLASAVDALGEGLVLVAGPGALEPPDAQEPADAALEEFLALCPRPVLVVLLPGEASPLAPQRTLVRRDHALLAGEQVVLDGQVLVSA